MARWHSSALSGLVFWLIAACGGISGSTGKGVPDENPSGGASGAGGRAGAGSVVTGTGGVVTGAGGVNTGAGGTPVPTCSPVSFSVKLEGFPPGTQVCDGAPNSCVGIGQESTIRDASGTPLQYGGWCSLDCSTCSRSPCPSIPCVPPTAGPTIDTAWNGMHTTAGTCGGGQDCSNPAACAPHGRYIAHLCGYVLPPGGSSPRSCDSAASTPSCVDLPFDFPTSEVVTGVLRP
jgi:hypothetical protein